MAGVGLLLVCLAFSGLSIPIVTIEDGVTELSSERSRELAARSLEIAEITMDHPLERLVFPAARVEWIRHRPGHCRPGDPGARSRDAAWLVGIRFYTFFAIPGPTVVVSCGGHSGLKTW